MKKAFFFILFIWFLFSCKDSPFFPGNQIVSNSGCKGIGLRTTDESGEGIVYSFADNVLTFTHVNKAGNCAAKYYGEIEVEANIITLTVKNRSLIDAMCLCLYDLEFQIDIDAGIYTLVVPDLENIDLNLIDTPNGVASISGKPSNSS